jgi:hypothetical protein
VNQGAIEHFRMERYVADLHEKGSIGQAATVLEIGGCGKKLRQHFRPCEKVVHL